jgi:hypothetical protein
MFGTTMETMIDPTSTGTSTTITNANESLVRNAMKRTSLSTPDAGRRTSVTGLRRRARSHRTDAGQIRLVGRDLTRSDATSPDRPAMLA